MKEKRVSLGRPTRRKWTREMDFKNIFLPFGDEDIKRDEDGVSEHTMIMSLQKMRKKGKIENGGGGGGELKFETWIQFIKKS